MDNNRGSVSIEAAIALPMFLFTMLFLAYVSEISAVRATVYEGCIETAEYMAEYVYLANNISEDENLLNDALTAGTLLVRFNEYVDNDALLEKYVVGGKNGVSFLGSSLPDDHGYIDLEIRYFVHIDIPLINGFTHMYKEHIRQRAYLGSAALQSETEEEEDRYVFVAKNGVVYHTTRSCTYLSPDIQVMSKTGAAGSGYTPCEYCGAQAGDSVYVTGSGSRYHSSKQCSRLMRTVERKKLSEVNLPPCSKCGD